MTQHGDTPFGELNRRQQLDRVRRSAHGALVSFGFEDATLRLVNHDFNTTYKVTLPSGERFALRVNLNSTADATAVEAEAQWVHQLASIDEIQVPYPQRTREGGFVAMVECDGFSAKRPAVLYSWLPGRNIGDNARPVQYRALGKAMALLHEQTAHPTPELASIAERRPRLNSTLLGEPDRMTAEHPSIDDATHRFLREVIDHVEQMTSPIYSGPTQLVHADLHGNNAKWANGELAVFDFDDCGVATCSQDLAICAFYVCDDPHLEAALYEGYESCRPLPAHTDDQFEALIASRNILLLNYVLGSLTLGTEDFMGEYLQLSVDRFRRYLDTGKYAR